MTQIQAGKAGKDHRTYELIGAAMQVHARLGCGFLEAVYAEALAIELGLREVPFEREVAMPVFYKQRELPVHYRVDFLCFSSVYLEIKAVKEQGPIERAQLLNYLKIGKTGSVGLLLNIGAGSLQYERLIV